jgi:hypothetical protein
MAKKNSKEGIYKDYFESLMNTPNTNITPPPVLPSKAAKEEPKSFMPLAKEERTKSIPKPHVRTNEHRAMLYEDVVISTLPMGAFYPVGTRIQFRDLTVAEVEHFSTLDESSEHDFIDKLNDILENCLLFHHADGTLGSYLDLKEGDRPWMIYMIRERTFPNGKVLSVRVPYINTNGENAEATVEFRRENFEIYDSKELMDEFFDAETRSLVLDTVFRDEAYSIAPPTIGLKRCFDQYLKIKVEAVSHLPEEEVFGTINTKFMWIAPYMKPNVTYMSYEDIEAFQKWFESDISPEEYSFLHDLFQHHLKIGIAGLKKNMDTATVRYYKVYPNRRSALFLLPDAFRLYLRHKTDTQ